MDARKVAARFVAHARYEEVRAGKLAPKEATWFARDNWKAFMSVVPKGPG